MSITKILSWASVADTLTLAVAQLKEGDHLDGQNLRIADAIAAALRSGSNMGLNDIAERVNTTRFSLQQWLADVDRVFDRQPDNVKLAVWAAFAVTFEDENNDEAVARLHSSVSAGNLTNALRLHFEDVEQQEAQRFAEAVFGPGDRDLVANWICHDLIFPNN